LERGKSEESDSKGRFKNGNGNGSVEGINDPSYA
jgi:hypothetical protein